MYETVCRTLSYPDADEMIISDTLPLPAISELIGRETWTRSMPSPDSRKCAAGTGSGRTLLAANADRPQSDLVAWDIDYTCCLMCVCNFLINGCVGEVVCIDSLRMDNFRGAWIVNEALCRTGLPTVRKLDQKEYNLFKQSDIPPYVFFINQEGYDDYFRTRETWAKVMSLFHEPPTTQTGT